MLFVFLLTNKVSAEKELEVDLNLEDSDVAYTFFDLSHGEATLIQTGSGENILIGTGGSESARELEQRLKMYHVEKIDSVILTNQATEYTGNLTWVIDRYSVENLIIPIQLIDHFNSFKQVHEINVIGWKLGEENNLTSQVKTEILYVEETNPLLKGSAVILFTFEKHRMLYMGIADELVEKSLMEDYSLKSTILKVAEFGDAKGTSQPFLDEVDPQIAILFKKRGQCASDVVLERLQETWIEIYQTYRFGTVSVKCHTDDYEILTVKPPVEEFSFRLANIGIRR